MARNYTDKELALTPTPGESEMLPWDPSPLEKQSHGIASLLRKLGYDNYRAQQLAENTTFLSEFIPGFGDVQGLREGKHMMEEGSPKLGAAVMGLSAIPFVPITPIRKALQKGIKVSPTKVERTHTDWESFKKQRDAGSFKEFEEDIIDAHGNVDVGETPRYTSLMPLQVGRLNFETNAERQLLSNPDFANPNKAYDVDGFIKSTVANSPNPIRTTVKSQLDEWVSPALRGKKATIQDILDDIGKNKPTIKENYMDDATNARTRYMPNIPTTPPPSTAREALQVIHPAKYTERSFSVHSPKHGKLFEDPGHTEVSGGALPTRSLSHLTEEFTNSANRIFTTRSGLYDIDGQKVFIPAEGQSGIYRMGTSKSKAARTVSSPQSLTSGDIQHLLATGEDLSKVDSIGGTWGRDFISENEAATRDHFINTLESTGNKDKWKDLVKEQQFDLDVTLDELKLSHDLPDDVDWHSVDSKIFQQAELLTQDNAIEYGRKLSDLLKVDVGDAIEPPLFKEWFPMHMKTSLNDAVEVGADVVRFPVNPESVAKQTGQPLNPGRARAWSDELSTDPYRTEPDDVSNWLPGEEAEALGKIYKQRTKDGIKRIEAEYGIKLNAKPVKDDNYNEFLEIVLTPELKEAFQTVVYKDGGAVYKKPLMNLKY